VLLRKIHIEVYFEGVSCSGGAVRAVKTDLKCRSFVQKITDITSIFVTFLVESLR
jgi:hypothetical protein